MRSKLIVVSTFAALLFLVGGARGADPTFSYGFAGVPAADVPAANGEVKTIADLFVSLTTANNTATVGASGWTVSFAVIGATVKTRTVAVKVDAIYDEDPGDGTPVIHHDHFDFDLRAGAQGGNAFFSGTDAGTSDYTNSTLPPGLNGILAWTVMGSTTLATLQPNGTANIAKFSIDATAPTTVQFKFIDLLKGKGVPQPNAVTFNTNPFTPTFADASFKVGAAPTACTEPEYAVYFGAEAKTGEVDLAGATEAKVGLRNKEKGWGFSLGIQKNGDKLTFYDDPTATPALDLLFTKEDGKDVAIVKGNSAKGAPQDPIKEVVMGAALTAIGGGDFLAVGVNATGDKAKVGYVSDASGSGKTIAATTDDATGKCGVQEVLIVKFSAAATKFSRGDANGDSKINVTDAVLIAQNIFANKLVIYNCKAMLDVNDDNKLNTADPVDLLKYVFMSGAAPAAPFRTCGTDTTTMECAQPNCQ